MVFAEALGMDQYQRRVRIFATDLDGEAVGTARRGRFSEDRMHPVTERIRDKYFDRTGSSFSCADRLRASLVFGRQDGATPLASAPRASGRPGR